MKFHQIIDTEKIQPKGLSNAISRGFAKVQILIKVKLAVSLEPSFWNILIKFCIHTDIDELQPKVLPNVIFHTIWSGFAEVKILK